jgi:flagellar protein FlgJ
MPHHSHHKRRVHHAPSYVTLFIHTHVAKAQEISKRTRVPVSVILAQAAEESSWGRAAPDNAYFGIKGKSPNGNTANHGTHEVVGGKSIAQTDNFRVYASFDEAADDYADFLVANKAYAAAFAFVNDPVAFAHAIGSSKYATNPQYGANLVSIIKTNNLVQYEVNPK